MEEKHRNRRLGTRHISHQPRKQSTGIGDFLSYPSVPFAISASETWGRTSHPNWSSGEGAPRVCFLPIDFFYFLGVLMSQCDIMYVECRFIVDYDVNWCHSEWCREVNSRHC